MAQPPIQEAMSAEEYERWDKGLPPLPKRKEVKADAAPLKEEGELTANEVLEEADLPSFSAVRQNKKNKDGIIFICFNVTYLKNVEQKGKKATAQKVEGWMVEGEFLRLLALAGNRIERKNIQY